MRKADFAEKATEYFLRYSEEVLTNRAIPNAEDGLLSAGRKIIWTMEDVLKMTSSSNTKKSASIVGTTLAACYTHGDAACYGSMVKIAQPYLMRYPLIDGQGNFGSQEANGTEAASRYTEARPSIFGDLLYTDFKKNSVPCKETYNQEHMEPVVLPAAFPNALCNGGESIAIGLAHGSCPNNLTEVCDVIIGYIKGEVETIDDVLEIMPGPDFPLGGTVINSKDIKIAFQTGKSPQGHSIKVRGDYEINKESRTIVFTSIPYRTYRSKIKEQFGKNIDEMEKYFEDFSDESNLGINKLVFTYKKDINVEDALTTLFALTDLQTSLSYNMNFIIDGTPRLCSILELIDAYVTHRHKVLINIAKFDKEKAEARLHIILGLLKAINKIDEVIKIIRESNSRQTAATVLKKFLEVDDIQVKAILDMKIGTLSKLDKNKLEQEKIEKEQIIEACKKVISSCEYRDEILISQLTELKEKYGDERRTKLENLDILSTINKGRSKKVKEPTQIRLDSKTMKLSDKGDIATMSDQFVFLFGRDVMGHRIPVDKIKSSGIPAEYFDESKHNWTTGFATGSDLKGKKWIISLTEDNYIRKVPMEEFTSRNRRQFKFTHAKPIDVVIAGPDDYIQIKCSGNRYLNIYIDDIPSSKKTAKGRKAVKSPANDEGFKIISMSLKKIEKDTQFNSLNSVPKKLSH